jgi:hypothetical protein
VNDFYDWTQKQASALRRKTLADIDWDNLAKEIEWMGRGVASDVRSRLTTLLVHLLKWRFQPELQCRSWRSSIDQARGEIENLIEESPSLQSLSEEKLHRAYTSARRTALQETGLFDMPAQCPWLIGQVLDPEFFP